MSMPRLLILDDDVELSEMLAAFLRSDGFEVELLHRGDGAVPIIERLRPDLVILDVMLPGEDGLSIVRRISPRWPVLMLSARGEDLDRIIGLELGADDYMAKPFNPRELLSRIKAHLRRRTATGANGALRFGPFELDLDSRTLRREGVPVMLTTAEFTLLKIFATNPEKVLSRDDLIGLVHGEDRMPFDRSIDVQVSRLRQLLQDNGREPRIIKTVRNGGYVLAVAVERLV
ncbi:MAG TPA: response regulator, partial [Burkholderiales bacterium]|nr:response regulator [Burkholderiales bacterium]